MENTKRIFSTGRLGVCAAFAILISALLLTGCGWKTAAYIPTLEEKIGQMLLVGFRGTAVDSHDAIMRDIREYNLGGVILFDKDVLTKQDRNVTSPGQVKALVKSLQQEARTPLFVAMDQEGGRVARLKEKNGFPSTLSHRELGLRNNLDTTTQEADKIAATLAGLGINLNMAPVVDLCVNPGNPVIAKLGRCFSEDPARTVEHALAFIQAHHNHGVLTVLKHFPGHGSSRADSHLGFTDISATWTPSELLPFTRLIASGQADAIMTAHVFNARLDRDNPATLSRSVVTGMLREKFCFDGVVISDDMQMRAISDYYGLETAVARAVDAGVDILVFGNNLDNDENIVPRIVALIADMVHSGKITEARIDQSYQRIMGLKKRIGHPGPAD